MMQNFEANCCGSASERKQVIERVTKALVQGHTGLAMLYQTFAQQEPPHGVKGTAEEAEFRAEAERQLELAKQSGEMLIPEGM